MDEMYGWLGPEPEEYKFYGGRVTLYYDDEAHSYFRYVDDEPVLIPGVTTVVGVYDKSKALMQWSANLTSDYIEKKCDEFPSADCATVKTWLSAARFNHRDYKENAADIGHIAHAWIEKYIKNEISGDRYMMDLPENKQAGNGVIAALNWMNRHKVRWLFTERKIYSLTHDYAGTKDGLAYASSCDDPECCGHWVKRDGRWVREAVQFTDALVLIDWKTSNSFHTSYTWQTAGYLKAMEEEIGLNSEHPELTGDIKYRIVVRLSKDDAAFEAHLLMPDTLERDFQTFLYCLSLYRIVDTAEEEEKQRKREVRQQAKDDRDEQRKIACPKSAEFKGTRSYPKCNGTDQPCETCLKKWKENHADAQDNPVEISKAA